MILTKHKEKHMKKPSQHDIKIIRSRKEIEEIRSFWEKVQYHPNTDIDHYLTVIDSLDNVISPYIILFSVDGQPETLAVGRIENNDMVISLGYKTFYKVKVKCLTILYAGLLGNWSNEINIALVRALMKELRYKVADIAWFNLLHVQSDLYNISKKIPNYFCRDHVIEKNTHWKMTLPDSFDSFLKKMTAKHRYWLNRLPRVFQKDYPGKIEYKYFKNGEYFEQLIADIERIARKSYQRGIGAGFIDNSMMRQCLSVAAKKGHMRAYLLYVDDEPCAFWIGTLYKNIFYLDYTSYDATYKRYEPGTILFMRMLEDIITESKATEIDFGFGDAFYKQRFGNQQWMESSVFLYAPTIKGAALNLMRTLNVIPYRYAMRLAERTNILPKVKRLWRNKLIDDQSNTDADT